MLVIRFSRVGRRNRAQYRIVVQDKKVAPTGRHVAIVGSWDPHLKKGVFKTEEIKRWINQGAQISDTVWNLLIKKRIIEGKKRPVKFKAKKGKEGEKENENDKKNEDKLNESKEESQNKKENIREGEEKKVENSSDQNNSTEKQAKDKKAENTEEKEKEKSAKKSEKSLS